jgi:hypothetical protein
MVRLQQGRSAVVCRASDISEDGLRLHGPWWNSPGEQVELRFELLDEEIRVHGRVTWLGTPSGSAAWAVTFTSVSPLARRLIRLYVAVNEAVPDGWG